MSLKRAFLDYVTINHGLKRRFKTLTLCLNLAKHSRLRDGLHVPG